MVHTQPDTYIDMPSIAIQCFPSSSPVRAHFTRQLMVSWNGILPSNITHQEVEVVLDAVAYIHSLVTTKPYPSHDHSKSLPHALPMITLSHPHMHSP